jgi:hypothetical protein
MNNTAEKETIFDVLNEVRKRIDELSNRANNKDYRFPADDPWWLSWIKDNPVASIAIAIGIIAVLVVLITMVIRKFLRD